MKLKNNHNFSSKNYEFNNSIIGIIGNTFQTEDIGISGYVEGNEYKKNTFKSTPVHDKNELDIEKMKALLDAKYLPFETVLETCKTKGGVTLYTLIGAMGSGKTSSIKHVQEKIYSTYSGVLDIYINFNEGYTQRDINIAKRKFIRDLKDNLKAKMLVLIKDKYPECLEYFIEALKNKIDKYPYFVDFRATAISENWSPISEVRLNNVYGFIGQRADKDEEEYLDGLMKFLKVLNDEFCKQNDIIVYSCYDNIDKFPPDLQLVILKYILELHRTSKVRCILPLRRSTFTKLRNRAALSFQNINQTGPKPIAVVIALLKKLQNEWEEISDKFNLTSYTKTNLKNKIGDLLDFLTQPQNRTVDLYNNLCGKSIKIGLRLAQRFLITDFIPYNEKPENQNSQYSRSLLTPFLYENGNLREAIGSTTCENDVMNLFNFVNTNQLDFLKIRILQLLKNFEKIPENRRVEKIIDIISQTLLNNNYEENDYLDTLNDLMFDERALIGGEKRAIYSNYDELSETNDILRITELGECYLKLLGDVRYVQEMLFQIEIEEMSKIDVEDTINNRFAMLREYLYEVIDIDAIETSHFKNWSVEQNFTDRFKPLPISSYIVYNCTRAFMNIANSTNKMNKSDFKFPSAKKEFLPELRNWQTLIYTVLQNDSTNQSLNKLSYNLDELVENTESNNV